MKLNTKICPNRCTYKKGGRKRIRMIITSVIEDEKMSISRSVTLPYWYCPICNLTIPVSPRDIRTESRHTSSTRALNLRDGYGLKKVNE